MAVALGVAVGVAVIAVPLAVALAVALASSSLCCFATAAGARTNAATRATAVNNSNLLNGTSFGRLPLPASIYTRLSNNTHVGRVAQLRQQASVSTRAARYRAHTYYRSRLPARLTSDLLRHPMIVRNLILFSRFQTCCAPLSTGLCGVGLLMGNATGHPCDPEMR